MEIFYTCQSKANKLLKTKAFRTVALIVATVVYFFQLLTIPAQ